MILRPIPSQPGYYASDDGRIFSDRWETWRPRPRDRAVIDGKIELKTNVRRGTSHNGGGYPTVAFYRRGRGTRRFYVHRLVADAFLGPLPEGAVVNHKNRDRADARLDNLEVVSFSQNLSHAHEDDAVCHALRNFLSWSPI